MSRPRAFDESVALRRAMEVFWRKGFRATSIQDLVDALGVNRASLYATFGGKEELFHRTLDAYRKENEAALRAFATSGASALAAIRTLFERAVEQIADDRDRRGCFVVNVTAELGRPENARVYEFLVLNEATVTGLWRELLERAVADGDLGADRDLDALADFLFALYSGVKVISKLHDDPVRLQRTIAEAMRALA